MEGRHMDGPCVTVLSSKDGREGGCHDSRWRAHNKIVKACSNQRQHTKKSKTSVNKLHHQRQHYDTKSRNLN